MSDDETQLLLRLEREARALDYRKIDWTLVNSIEATLVDLSVLRRRERLGIVVPKSKRNSVIS